MIRSITSSSDSSYSYSLTNSSASNLDEPEEMDFNDVQQEIRPPILWTEREKEIVRLAYDKIGAVEKDIQNHLSPLIHSPDFEKCHPHLFMELKQWIPPLESVPVSPHLAHISEAMQSLSEKDSIDNELAEELNRICLMDLKEIVNFSDYLLLHRFFTTYRDFFISEKSISIEDDIFSLLAKDIVPEDDQMGALHKELYFFLSARLQTLNSYYLSPHRDKILAYASLLSTAAEIAVIATATFVTIPPIAASQNIEGLNDNPAEFVAAVCGQLENYVVIQMLQEQSLSEDFDLKSQSKVAEEFAAIEKYYIAQQGGTVSQYRNALNILNQSSEDWELPYSIQLDALLSAAQNNPILGPFFKRRALCLAEEILQVENTENLSLT